MSARSVELLPQMEVTSVGGGTQYRAYCDFCQVGLNWWADGEGKDAAECYAARHNTGYPHQQ